MDKYKFTVDGISVTVCPTHDATDKADLIADELCESELSMLLYPDRDADFRVDCFYKNTDTPREPHLILAALSCFFGRVRSYPAMTLEIATPDNKYDLVIGKDYPYNFSVNRGKCKILYSKALKFSDEIEIVSNLIEGEEVYAAVICEDADTFDNGRLELLFNMQKEKGIKAALVLSRGEILNIKYVGKISLYEAARVGAFALYRKGCVLDQTDGTSIINGKEIRLSHSRGVLTFYPEIKYLS